jgi:hypothetical protein
VSENRKPPSPRTGIRVHLAQNATAETLERGRPFHHQQPCDARRGVPHHLTDCEEFEKDATGRARTAGGREDVETSTETSGFMPAPGAVPDGECGVRSYAHRK